MSNFHIESGIQFLARVRNSKQTLQNIDNVLFRDGLNETNVVEFSAENNQLKNVILMHLLKKATLTDSSAEGVPPGYSSINILYIDTAFNFKLNQFATCLTRHLEKFKVDQLNEDMRKTLIENSLDSIIFIRCYDSQQLLVTFQTLHTVISQNPKIKLLVVDDMGSNYWQDFCNGGLKRMDLYEKRIYSVLQNCIKDFSLIVFYVRPEFFVRKNPTGNKNVNYNVRLIEKDGKVEVTVHTKSSTYKRCFEIKNEGHCEMAEISAFGCRMKTSNRFFRLKK